MLPMFIAPIYAAWNIAIAAQGLLLKANPFTAWMAQAPARKPDPVVLALAEKQQ